MVTKSVHLRLNEELYKQIKVLEKNLGFSNVQEFIRDMIRHVIDEYETKLLIRKLKKLQGSAKLKKNPLSREKMFKAYMKKDPLEIFRKFGLKV